MTLKVLSKCMHKYLYVVLFLMDTLKIKIIKKNKKKINKKKKNIKKNKKKIRRK